MAQNQDHTDGIALIHSLAQLRDLEPVLTTEGQQCRLGLAEACEAASQWMLLYCLATYLEAENAVASESGPRGGGRGTNRLGPLSFTFGASCSEYIAVSAEKKAAVSRIPESRLEELFCSLVPVSSESDTPIHVFSPEGELLSRIVLPCQMTRSRHWLPFLRHATPEDDQRTMGLHQLIGGMYKLQDEFVPAEPIYTGDEPVWVRFKEDSDVRIPEFGLPGQLPPSGGYQNYREVLSRHRPRGPQVYALPAALVQGYENVYCPLRLCLRDNRFEIHVAPLCWSSSRDLEDCLLARWWINGQAVEQPQLLHIINRVFHARVARSDSIPGTAIKASLPPFLGPAGPGDRTRLQVMYCPDGYREVRDSSENLMVVESTCVLRDSIDRKVSPLVSNVLEFTVEFTGVKELT